MLYCASYVVCSLITSEVHLFLIQGSFLMFWKVELIWTHGDSNSFCFYFLDSFFLHLRCIAFILSSLTLWYMDFPQNLLSVFDIFWKSMKNVFSSSQLLLLASKPSCHHYVFLLKSYTFLSILVFSFSWLEC